MNIYTILFFNIFLVYLYTTFPTIAPYRDAGEMCCIAKILGIGHPPGYPLYTLVATVFSRIIPFGNYAYKINILSGITSAFTGVLLFYLGKLVIKHTIGKSRIVTIILYFIILTFSLSYLQWYLSLVSEMYTLGTLFGILVLLLSYKYFFIEKKWFYITFFIFAIGLGNRLDLVLFSPILLMMFLHRIRNNKYNINSIFVTFFLFFLGITSYLYLILRSSQLPLIDWNHPAELSRFWASLTRKTHGSTLDMLSLAYRSGENFISGIKLYFSYLNKNISVIGIILSLIGMVTLYKNNILFYIATLLSWGLSSVWFIYTANLPPNPHAMAILEAHFLLPNLVIFFWLITGIITVVKRFNIIWISFFLLIVSILVTATNFKMNLPKLNKRKNFYSYDYTVNLFRSLPDNSIVVIKEDVQLFSMWYRQYVENFRKSVFVVAAGLAGSKWYKDMYSNYLFLFRLNPNIFLTSLNDKLGWEEFINQNLLYRENIYITHDVETVLPEKYHPIPWGLTTKISRRRDKDNAQHLLDEIYIYRDNYVYDLDKDFFSSDLVDEYAKSRFNFGNKFLTEMNYTSAITEFKTAITLNDTFPGNYFYLGYTYFSMNDFISAEKFYFLATRKFKEYFSLAEKYNALPDVLNGIKNQTANAYLHLGVVSERLGKLDYSMECYQNALEYNPNLAEAYYNLGVVYWHKKDWDKVKMFFQKTLQINPEHHQARFYLNQLQ